MKLFFTTEALLELEDARRYYHSKRRSLALEFAAELEQATAEILRAPRQSPIFCGEVRRYLLNRFPYGVFYEEFKGEITVLGVRHLMRRPFPG